MLNTPIVVPDPRAFPDPGSAPEWARGLYSLAERSLRAETAQRADAFDRELRDALLARLVAGGPELVTLLADAPSIDLARHLWRSLDAAWRDATPNGESALTVNVFALPLVVVVGREGAGDDGMLPGIVDDPVALAGILREHRALAGNETFALANALVAADAIDVARWPEIFAWSRLPEANPLGPRQNGERLIPARAFVPSPLRYHAGREGVHLRFLVGVAVGETGGRSHRRPGRRQVGRPAGPGTGRADPARGPRRCSRCRGRRSVCSRPSRRAAPRNARSRRRSSRATPFAGSAAPWASRRRSSARIARRMRPAAASFGFRCRRPSSRARRRASAVRSTRWIASATSWRCWPSLMRDCRVTDIRALAGVHADRDPGTGLPLLFKPDTIPDSAGSGVH